MLLATLSKAWPGELDPEWTGSRDDAPAAPEEGAKAGAHRGAELHTPGPPHVAPCAAQGRHALDSGPYWRYGSRCCCCGCPACSCCDWPSAGSVACCSTNRREAPAAFSGCAAPRLYRCHESPGARAAAARRIRTRGAGGRVSSAQDPSAQNGSNQPPSNSACRSPAVWACRAWAIQAPTRWRTS